MCSYEMGHDYGYKEGTSRKQTGNTLKQKLISFSAPPLFLHTVKRHGAVAKRPRKNGSVSIVWVEQK